MSKNKDEIALDEWTVSTALPRAGSDFAPVDDAEEAQAAEFMDELADVWEDLKLVIAARINGISPKIRVEMSP